METNKFLLDKLNSVENFKKNGFIFTETNFVQIKNLNLYLENLGFYSENKKRNINLRFDFVINLPGRTNINCSDFIIFNTLNGENLQINNYLSSKYGNSSKMSLDNYPGNSINEKLNNFFVFFTNEISSPPIKDILEGTYWTGLYNLDLIAGYR